jgi:hypothetical protein
MWSGPDNQDVGLEAAIIARVRNSSLVESDCAENVTGLKPMTEAVPCRKTGVGERSWVAEKVERERHWSEAKCECRNE